MRAIPPFRSGGQLSFGDRRDHHVSLQATKIVNLGTPSSEDAGRAKTRFGQFLATAVAEYKFTGASLAMDDPSGQIVPRYERLVGTPSRDGRLDALTLEQSDRCIDELIRDEASAAGAASRFILAQSFGVTKWRIDGEDAPTQSLLGIHYGQLPCLMTMFQFQTIEQFQCIQRVLADIGLCKLNEKHLKPMKITETK